MIKNFLENKKAVLFDLDGTLVDSMWMWEAIDIEFLGAYGYECPDDIQRAIEGMSFSETAVYFKERFDLPLSLDEIKQSGPGCRSTSTVMKYLEAGCAGIFKIL